MQAGSSQIETHYRKSTEQGVIIPISAALNRQILLDLKAVKQEQGLSVNFYPWCHGPTH